MDNYAQLQQSMDRLERAVDGLLKTVSGLKGKIQKATELLEYYQQDNEDDQLIKALLKILK